jgi:hypothetical protein
MNSEMRIEHVELTLPNLPLVRPDPTSKEAPAIAVPAL